MRQGVWVSELPGFQGCENEDPRHHSRCEVQQGSGLACGQLGGKGLPGLAPRTITAVSKALLAIQATDTMTKYEFECE